MGHRKFTDVVGDINTDRRRRIDAIKQDANADAVAFNLAELRRARNQPDAQGRPLSRSTGKAAAT